VLARLYKDSCFYAPFILLDRAIDFPHDGRMAQNGKSGSLFSVIKAGFSQQHYHRIMNYIYEEVYGEHFMVHFPYYGKDDDSLFDGQKNLTEACLAVLPPLKGKTVLEIGCGNGMQSIYMKQNHGPAMMIGIDINPENVELANRLATEKKLEGIVFHHSNAQKLHVIEDNSIDVIVNVESAFHYPEKEKFFAEIFRVLKPGASFMIADILANRRKVPLILQHWEKKLFQNYWLMPRYVHHLLETGLVLEQFIDITEPVISGWMVSKNYFKNMHIEGFWMKLFIIIFGKLQILRHVYYLRKQCGYYIFQGKKPAK